MKKLLYLLAIACLAGCTADLDEQEVKIEREAKDKIIYNDTDAALGSLLVKVDPVLSRALATTTKAEDGTITRSGIATFDDALLTIEGARLERLFPIDARNEEATKAAGLDRWYVISFDEDFALTRAATRLAEVSNVESVEYNVRLKKEWDATKPKNIKARADFKHILNGGGLTRAGVRTDNCPFNDGAVSLQWHYNNIGPYMYNDTLRSTYYVQGADINLFAAWEIEAGDKDLIVAICDEGVDVNHPELAPALWTNTAEKNGTSGRDDDNNGYKDDLHGYNFAANGAVSTGVTGDSGHGTHVAGTVGAVNNDGRNICGVAGGNDGQGGVRLMSCQIFSGKIVTTIDMISKAIKYAADNGAAILQCSWGIDAGNITSDGSFKNGSSTSAEYDVLQYFVAKKNYASLQGGLVVFAAGNESTAMAGYPAGFRDYLAVAAVSCKNTPTFYTNYGSGCNIAATGGDWYSAMTESSNDAYLDDGVISTYPTNMSDSQLGVTGYESMQGTSMACPHMSGVAALGLSLAKKLGKVYTVKEFQSLLCCSVNDLDPFCTGKIYFLDQNSSGQTTKYYTHLSLYLGNMGSGLIDAYKLLMNIKGTPVLNVDVSSHYQNIDLTPYIGKCTLKSVTLSSAAMTKLGIDSTNMPSVSGQTLHIMCTKPGSCTINLTMVAGGKDEGTDSKMGGMGLEKEIAIIARHQGDGSDRWL